MSKRMHNAQTPTAQMPKLVATHITNSKRTKPNAQVPHAHTQMLNAQMHKCTNAQIPNAQKNVKTNECQNKFKC